MYLIVMLLKRLCLEEPVTKSSDFVIKLRLCLFGVAWIHVCIAAVLILPIDMSQDEDPKVRAYSRLRWRFITAWFNLINLAYFPLCFYCDWKEKRRQENERLVGRARRVRDIVFTSILFPTIMWADICFWQLYTKDMSLIAPPRLFDYMPAWGQHSLHTVSLLMVVIDLLLIPRRRPDKLKPRVKLMTAFFFLYCVVIMERYLKGEMVYQVLGTLTGAELLLFATRYYVESLIYFSLQWFVIDFVWRKRDRRVN